MSVCLFTFPLAVLESQTEHFCRNENMCVECDVLDKHIGKDF